MNEEIRSAIALLAGATVLVFGYVKLFFKGRSRRQKFMAKAEAMGHFTTATLIDHKRRLGDTRSENEYFKNDRMVCVYEYVVNGVSYKKKITFQSPGRVAIKFPHTITVYYDLKNPAKSLSNEEVSQGPQRSAGCLGTIAVAAITFIVLYNLLKLV